jgi:SAM-dependent methyltransferase
VDEVGTDGDARIHAGAESFDAAADVYDRARPGYPDAVLDAIRRRLDLRPGRTVADLGAGTGKLTRGLVATGATVIAVEPVAGMRRELTRRLPDIEVVDATAEELPFATASLDAATAAQAFHWFDLDRALPELHRVLRPGATLAVVLNRRAKDTPAQAVIEQVRSPLRRDTPSWDDHTWEQRLADPPGFEVDRDPPVRHEQRVDLDTAVDRVASVSFIAGLDEATRGRVLAEARERLAEVAEGDLVHLVHDAEVTWLVRRP